MEEILQFHLDMEIEQINNNDIKHFCNTDFCK